MVDVVGSIQEIYHWDGYFFQLPQVVVKSMVKHELDDFKDLQSHHILSYLEDILNALGLMQVILHKSFDRSQRSRHRYFGLLDCVDKVLGIYVLFFDKRWKLVPDSCLRWDLDRLKWFSVHVHVQEYPHE